MNGKTVLVTGGLGFIGSNFILYMLDRYPSLRVINLDLMTYAGNPENVKSVAHLPNYTFIHGDIREQAVIDSILSQYRIDYIVHFAAQSHVDRSIAKPHLFVSTNVLGTLNLLECARRHDVKRFIHISTDEVYGSLGLRGSFTEKSPLKPNSPYAASKAGADLIARSFFKTYRFPVIITRCSNNYGPRQFPEKLIPLIITRALKNETIPIYGDGQNVRDWLFVLDHCRAIELVMTNGKPGNVYNIGANNEQTNLALAHLILSELGKPFSLIEFVADRLGHDKRYAINASKIRRELAWKPAYSFMQGLKETIAWYINNKAWWERILKEDVCSSLPQNAYKAGEDNR